MKVKEKSIVRGDSLSKSTSQTLLIMGNNDSDYIPKKVELLKTLRNIEINELADANHSLEIEGCDISNSLTCLNITMNQLNHFIKEC